MSKIDASGFYYLNVEGEAGHALKCILQVRRAGPGFLPYPPVPPQTRSHQQRVGFRRTVQAGGAAGEGRCLGAASTGVCRRCSQALFLGAASPALSPATPEGSRHPHLTCFKTNLLYDKVTCVRFCADEVSVALDPSRVVGRPHEVMQANTIKPL